MSDRLLMAKDVAELPHLRANRDYALARADEIPHLRFGRSLLRFRPEAIDQWLREQEQRNGRAEYDARASPGP